MLLKTGERYLNAKKIICLLLVLFNMLVFMPVMNYGEPNRSLKIGSIENGIVQNIYDVPILFEDLPGNGLSYFKFELNYDETKLEFVKANKYTNENSDFFIDKNNGGSITFEFISQGHNLKLKSKFVDVQFRIISDIETESIITAVDLIVSPVGSYTIKNGRVTVSKTTTNTPKNTPTNTPTSTPTKSPNTPTSKPSDNFKNGLLGEYYNWESSSQDFKTIDFFKSEKKVFEQIDSQINFDWKGDGAKKSGSSLMTESNCFSVRWTGYIDVTEEGFYKFYTRSDDGVKVIIDGQVIIEDLNKHDNSNEVESNNKHLSVGKHSITVEYFEEIGEASMVLSWSRFGGNKEIIPANRFFHIDQSSTPTPTATQKKPTATPTKPTATPTSTAAQSSPTPTATQAPYIPQPPPIVVVQPSPTAIPLVITSDLSLSLSSDKTTYDAGQNVVFTIHYRNRLGTEIGNVKLSSDIPPNTTFVEGAGGIVAGNKITWDLGTLPGNKEGTVKYTVKVDSFEGEDKEVSVAANIGSTTSTDATIDDNKSVLKIMLYSTKVLGSHKKYINGYTDGTFKPDKPITRAEISALIVRVSEVNSVSSDKQIFTDVSKDHWAFKDINTAVANGFFKGATATLFKPDANITKGELAAVICRCLGIEESSIDKEDFFFSDTKDHWAGEFIEELYRCKIVVGNAGKFYPKNQVTRAEAVTMINRWLYRGPLNGVTLKFKDVPTSHWGYGHIAEAVYDHKYSRDPKGGEKYEGESK